MVTDEVAHVLVWYARVLVVEQVLRHLSSCLSLCKGPSSPRDAGTMSDPTSHLYHEGQSDVNEHLGATVCLEITRAAMKSKSH